MHLWAIDRAKDPEVFLAWLEAPPREERSVSQPSAATLTQEGDSFRSFMSEITTFEATTRR